MAGPSTLSAPSRTRQEFTLEFIRHGDQEHDISATDYATALMGLTQTFERANGLLIGNSQIVNLRINASVAGSFSSKCVLLSQLVDAAQLVMMGDFDSARSNLIHVIFGEDGMVQAIKMLGRQRSQETVINDTQDTEETLDSSAIAIEVDAPDIKYAISDDVLRVLEDREARDGLVDLVSILHGETDQINVKENDTTLASVESHEAPYFSNIIPETDIQTTLQLQRLQIVTVAFDARHVWYLKMGSGNSRSYTMRDEEFKRTVSQGREFRNGDILVCQVLTTTEIQGDSEKEKREIIKVADHIRQSEFDI